VSGARHTWRCSTAGCAATHPNVRRPTGWHDDHGALPDLQLRSLRSLGSALRPSGPPRPLPSLAEFRLRRKAAASAPLPPAPKPGGASLAARRRPSAPRWTFAAIRARSNPAIAEAAGCSQTAVCAVRDRLEAEGAIEAVAYVFDARGRRIPLRRDRARGTAA
jgi:hypothetical protein